VSFQQGFANEISRFDEYLAEYFSTVPREDVAGIQKLWESIDYSTLKGGKRFRPVLAMIATEELGHDIADVMPFALAVELIHSYSLIHDDLPMLDNDDIRRGRPSNHKKFGEAVALLAGDALIAEAFSVLAESYVEDPELAIALVGLLSRAAGARGMVGGQAIDIHPMAGSREEWEIRYLHNLKTGALIRAAVDGAALIADVSQEVRSNLEQFAKGLGLAFQIADDVEDAKNEADDPASFVSLLGTERTTELLAEVTAQAVAALEAADLIGSRLEKICAYNLARVDSLLDRSLNR
jgi:geranylgeranyl diphosphate synthase, type II